MEAEQMDTAITSRVVSGTCDGWFTWRWYSCSMAGVWVLYDRCMADVWLMHAVGMAVAFDGSLDPCRCLAVSGLLLSQVFKVIVNS